MRLLAVAVAMLTLVPYTWIAAQEPSPESFVLRDLKLEIAIDDTAGSEQP